MMVYRNQEEKDVDLALRFAGKFVADNCTDASDEGLRKAFELCVAPAHPSLYPKIRSVLDCVAATGFFPNEIEAAGMFANELVNGGDENGGPGNADAPVCESCGSPIDEKDPHPVTDGIPIFCSSCWAFDPPVSKEKWSMASGRKFGKSFIEALQERSRLDPDAPDALVIAAGREDK